MAKKARRGRPPKENRDKRERRVLMLFTQDEYDTVKAASVAQGYPEFSQWARTVMLAAAKAMDEKK